jgi:hypothetical protein
MKKRSVCLTVVARFESNPLTNRYVAPYYFYMRSSPWIRDVAYEIVRNVDHA